MGASCENAFGNDFATAMKAKNMNGNYCDV